MKTKWNWIVILTMVFGLVFTGPKQTVFAATATADFTFTSSANPSNYGQPVTFTLSAIGYGSTYPPFGYVDFLDDGVVIPGCATVPLNYPGFPEAGHPATCTISSLSVGTHTITAAFGSIVQDIYADAVLTLVGGQTVTDSIALTIDPSVLSDGMLTVYYELPLTAYYPNGSVCSNCAWYITLGDLPDGVGLGGDTGVLTGKPTTVGTYAFTVVADDGNGAHGSRAYIWNVTKVKTIVDVGASSTYVGSTQPTTLGAIARNPDAFYTPAPSGTISFSVDGVPVPGCSGANAISTNISGQVFCTSYVPTGLAAGDHMIQADFTPNESSGATYLSGSGTGTLKVNPPQAIVSGRVFLDDNQNAVYDEGEAAQGTWHVNLNQDCDDYLEGDVQTYDITGAFTFYPVPIDGHTYCLYVNLSGFPAGYVQTTPYDNFTLSGDQFFEIGIYYPHITILPNSDELQSGSVGTYYEQQITISGGTPPYTIEANSTLADLTFNLDTLTLSGTPTAGGVGQLSISVVDSGGISASKDYSLRILADGDFTFESSLNPSALGEAVTFTLSATGEAVTPYGTLPPVGLVTFLADGTPIEGCS